MVEKMSSDMGQNSRASNALLKRHDSIQKWNNSETAREKPVRLPKQFTIKFEKGTCLLSAVASGDIEETVTLLDHGVDINYTNVDGLTALHQACIDENEEMVNLLIERGADIEARDNEGWTPLHAAASAGNVEIAQILCDHDADLAAVNNEGEVPLDLAEEEEMEDFLSDEIEKLDLEIEEARNEEERVMLEDVTNWLNSKKIDERKDWQGATALHVAAAKGYNKVISLLLQLKNIDVNVQDNDGWTPVHAAVHWGSKTACEMLTEAGGDFEVRNSNGQAPHELAEKEFLKTMEACRKKSKEIMKNQKNKRSDPEDNHLMLSAQKAIGLLKRQPSRSNVKGSREKSKLGNTKIINNDNTAKDSGTESASGESDHDSEVEQPAPPPTKPVTSPVKRNQLSDRTPITTTTSQRTASIGRKEEAKPADTSLSSRTTSRFQRNEPKEEPKEVKEESRPSRFSAQSRTVPLRTAPETKPAEKKDENPRSWSSRYTTTTKDEKAEDTRNKTRPMSKTENDDTDQRTRKKEESERNDDDSSEIDTKRLSRTSDDLSDSRRRTTDDESSRMTIAERLRQKNQELLSSSDRSSDRPSEHRISTDRTSAAGRYSSLRDKENTTSSVSSIRDRNKTYSTSDIGSGDKDLQRKLDQALKDVQDYKQKYEKAVKEKDELEKQLEQYKEDIEKMQELKNDNLRLKDENGALIRVISKLSRTPASSSS